MSDFTNCGHKVIICPNSDDGSAMDCHSFCSLCEGFGEYCETCGGKPIKSPGSIIEQVFVLDSQDLSQLYRIRSFIDNDGIFFASIDWLDQETGDWEESYLTQFQQDSADIVPIAADKNQEILNWFGFTAADIATQEQLDMIERLSN